MIRAKEIAALKGSKTFENKFKVVRAGDGIYRVIGYSYGKPEEKMIGYPHEVSRFLNSWFGYHLGEYIDKARDSKEDSCEPIQANWIESTDEYVIHRGDYIIVDGLLELEAEYMLDRIKGALYE